jgi:uncharacterized protein (TIGR04255 family)
LEDFAKFVSSTLSGFRAKRLGLRYINAFSPAEHQVSDVTDLSVEVLVRGTHVLPPILLNYQVNRATDVALTVRLASREFMAQGFRPNTSSVLDFDAFTPGNHRASTPASVLKWLDRAHDAVKAEFAQFVP